MQNQNDNRHPWSGPLQPSGVARPRLPVGENGLSYTPNEPDADEAIYAARAATARRRAAGLRAGVAQETAAAKPVSADTAPGRADAVLYSSATGILPQNGPENAFAAENGNHPGPSGTAPSQGMDTIRRRRYRDASADGETPPRPAEVQETPLREKAQQARESVAAFSGARRSARRRTDALKAAAEAENPSPPRTSDQPQTSFAPINARYEEPSAEEKGSAAPLLVNTSTVPFGLQPGMEWNLTNQPESDDEESGGEDHVDTGRMPVPVPAPAAPAAKTAKKKGTGPLVALIVVMLLVAACGFLWLSGAGEKLVDGANSLFHQTTGKLIKTGEMSVVPEQAAVPTALVVTLSTDNTIADLRLLDDQGNIFDADVVCNSSSEDCLWICRLEMDRAYTGFIRAQLLTRDGDWVMGSSSRYVNIN